MTKKKMKNWFLTGGNLRKKHKKSKNLKKLVSGEDGKSVIYSMQKKDLKCAKHMIIKKEI